LEYASKGDLLSYLKHNAKFNAKQLQSFAEQISSAMEHLENKNFIHRNLSAKSILVTDNEIVGIKDMYVHVRNVCTCFS